MCIGCIFFYHYYFLGELSSIIVVLFHFDVFPESAPTFYVTRVSEGMSIFIYSLLFSTGLWML